VIFVEKEENLGAEGRVIQPKPFQKLIVINLARAVGIYFVKDARKVGIRQQGWVYFVVLRKFLRTCVAGASIGCEGGGKESDVGCGLKAGAAHRLSLSADHHRHLRCRSLACTGCRPLPRPIRPRQKQLLREITFTAEGASRPSCSVPGRRLFCLCTPHNL